MTHDELREELAQAAYEAYAAVGTYDPPWHNLLAEDKTPWRETSELWSASLRRAGFAIVPALPTGGMLVIGNVVCGGGGSARDIWDAMIEATQEGKPCPSVFPAFRQWQNAENEDKK